MNKLAQINIGEELFREHSPGLTPTTTLGDIVSNILPNLYIAAAVIFFILLIFFGLGIIMGAGEQSPEKIQKSKQGLTWTIAGLLVVLGSYWIIQIIQVVTGLNILEPTGF